MLRPSILSATAIFSAVLLAGTAILAPIADAQPTGGFTKGGPPSGPAIRGPIVKGPILKGPVAPPKFKPIPPPKFKPKPPPKPPFPPKKPPHRPGINHWFWSGVTIYANDYDGCGYEYYKWKSTGSSYWRRKYRECRDWD